MWVLAIVVAAFPTATGPPLTHAQLVSRADAVCVRYTPRLASPGPQGKLGDPAFDAAWLTTFARQRRELAALRPSTTDTPAYGRFMAALPPVANAFRNLARSIERGRPVHTWAPLVRRRTAAERTAGTRARAVGLRKCFASAKAPSPAEPPTGKNTPPHDKDTPPPGRGKGGGGG